jgi:hypothetical protein
MLVKALRGRRSRIGETMTMSSWIDSRCCHGEAGTVVSIGLVGMEIILELRRWVSVFVRWEAVRMSRLGMDEKEGVRGVVGVVGSLVDIPFDGTDLAF